MDINDILKYADYFESLASLEKEELPKDSDDLDVVLKNIQKLNTYTARKKYAERNLKHLSSGSSRIVYLTSDDTIIKLAKNDRGIAQNKAESNPKMNSKFLNKILGKASNYAWIKTTYLKKITERQFKKMTGIDFNDFDEAIHYGLRTVSKKNKDKDKPDNFDNICEVEIYKEIVDIGKKFKLMPGDIGRISSWLTNGKIPILGDAGLTKDVFEEFYES